MDEREFLPGQARGESWPQACTGPAPENVPAEASPAVLPSLQPLLTHTLHPLLEAVAGLQRDFDAKVKYDTSKDRLIETLHRELQAHQQGLHFRVLQPVFLDLIAMFDDIGQLLAWIEEETLPASEQMVRHIRILQESVEEILRRHGVETFVREEDVFLPQKQRCVKTVPTADVSLDRHIARRVRCGFLYDEKLLRYELVDIYKYTPAQDAVCS